MYVQSNFWLRFTMRSNDNFHLPPGWMKYYVMFVKRENPLFYLQCIANDVANVMRLGRALCRLLAVGRLLHWILLLLIFFLFLRDFHFLDNHGSLKRSPQKVRGERMALNRAVWTTPIHSPHTSWKLPQVAKYLHVTKSSDSSVNLRKRWRLWSRCLLVWTCISAYVIRHRKSVSNGWLLFLKNPVPSQHSRQSKTYKTEQPFLPGVYAAKRKKMNE